MDPSQVSVILLGHWNPKIFRPSWIKTQLLGLPPDSELTGLLNAEELEFLFEHDGIIIAPKPTSLEFSISEYTESKSRMLGVLVLKIFELLPQTPIKAFGVNVKYNEVVEESNIFILELNKLKSSIDGFVLSQTKFVSKRPTHDLNVICEKGTVSTNINFNFHYPKIIDIPDCFIIDHINETKTLINNGK